MGGDTLDAFAPLSHYTHRVHNGQMESTWTKVSRSITLPDGTVVQGIKEKDYIPEATRLLSTKVEKPFSEKGVVSSGHEEEQEEGHNCL